MCGCLDVRMCECADVRMCGCANVRMCGYWICGCADVNEIHLPERIDVSPCLVSHDDKARL
jgi:hypothetical protein